jgi:hypothetical protein
MWILSISYLNHIIVPSMFLFIPLCDSMWSFRVKANMHKFLCRWFIYVFPLEIQLSRRKTRLVPLMVQEIIKCSEHMVCIPACVEVRDSFNIVPFYLPLCINF